MPKKTKCAKFTQTNLIDDIRNTGYGYKIIDKDRLKIIGANGFLDCVIDRRADEMVVLFNAPVIEGMGKKIHTKAELFDCINSLLIEEYEMSL